jgi:hypothetical protein
MSPQSGTKNLDTGSSLGGFNFILFGIAIGIKRKMIDISKKNFSHLHFKFAKSAFMTQKMGNKKTLISNSLMPAFKNP